MSPGISVLAEKRLAFKLEKPPGVLVLTENCHASKQENIASEFAPARKTPRIKTGGRGQGFLVWPETPPIQFRQYRQEFRFWPKSAAHLDWKAPPGILAPKNASN